MSFDFCCCCKIDRAKTGGTLRREQYTYPLNIPWRAFCGLNMGIYTVIMMIYCEKTKEKNREREKMSEK
jgi:hypothetical protein